LLWPLAYGFDQRLKMEQGSRCEYALL
jgi:hypothetical protein